MTPDLALAACLLSLPSDWERFKLDPEMLYDDGKAVVLFALAHLGAYGVCPTRTVVKEKLGIEVPEPPGPMAFYAAEIRLRWKKTQLGQALSAAIVSLEKNDPDHGISVVASAVARIASQSANGSESTLVNLASSESVSSRIAAYRDAKKLGGRIDGIPTPWPAIDRVTRGIHAGELWILSGRLKSGKSWSEILMGLHAWRSGWEAGRKVLLVSEEMAVDKIVRRWDAVAGGLPYNDFKTGALATSVEDAWVKSLSDLGGKPPFWVAGRHRVQSVADLELLAEELKPDIIFVDGAYFLDADGAARGNKWERTSQVVDRLQSLVQRKRRPIVASWQFNRSVRTGTTKGASEQIAFAYEVGQNADVVLGIFKNDRLDREKRAVLRLIESRESERIPPLLVEWDLDLMKFGELGPLIEGGGGGESGSEEDIAY